MRIALFSLCTCVLASTCLGLTVASYDPGLGTQPQSQGWTFGGSLVPPSSVSGGVFTYGPTTDMGTTFWRVDPLLSDSDFSTESWSISVDLRLTGAGFGNYSGLRRGGFALLLVDDAGRWITADLGSHDVSIRNDNVGLSDPQLAFDLSDGFHVVTLEAGPSGGRLVVDGVERLTLELGTNFSSNVLAYFGEASTLVSAISTEIRSVTLSVASCPGDVNGDGDTNALDFNILAGNFGSGPGATPAQGDLNGDGFVNALDFNILAGDFGCGTP